MVLGWQYEIQTTLDFRNDFITLDGLSYEDFLNKVSIGGFFTQLWFAYKLAGSISIKVLVSIVPLEFASKAAD